MRGPTSRRCRLASGSAPAAAAKACPSMASPISSSIWPSRAPRGAAPRTSPRRSRRLAASSMPRPASTRPPITRACCARISALALDILSDIILTPRFDRTELARERDVILQEIASAQDSPEDMVFDLVQATAFPDQPAGRPILGTAGQRQGIQVGTSQDLSLHPLSGAEHGARRRRRRRSREAPCRSRAPAGLARHRHRARARAGALSRRRGALGEALRADPFGARLRGAALPPCRLFRRASLRRRAWRRHVLAPLPGGAREARALLRDPRFRLRPLRRRHVRDLCGLRA